MAQEFLARNDSSTGAAFAAGLDGVPTTYLPREEQFKPRVPRATGLLRPGDATRHANIILVSA